MRQSPNLRHIHLKCDSAKLFTQLVMSQVKDILMDSMSKFQIAAKPGHRASEHLFFIKSVMALIQSDKRAAIITLWDISRYFDSESIFDSQSELYKSKIRGKLYRLIYKLNEDINVSVSTPVGMSEHQSTGSGVGQGRWGCGQFSES